MSNAQNIIAYQGYRWLKISSFCLAVLVLVYIFNCPIGGANGGSVLGYAYGGLATLGILHLMWFGVRKRDYYSTAGSAQSWLAAHIWIGILLLFLVPLHAGFSFGLNLHSFCYYILVLVVFSGIWGAINYVSMPGLIESHRGGGSSKQLLEQIGLIEEQIIDLARSKSDRFSQALKNLLVRYEPRLRKKSHGIEPAKLSEQISVLRDEERPDALKVISLAQNKLKLCHTLEQELRVKYSLRIWLYLHVPLSCLLLILVFIHIFVVFYRW